MIIQFINLEDETVHPPYQTLTRKNFDEFYEEMATLEVLEQVIYKQSMLK